MAGTDDATPHDLAEQLERGELVRFLRSPFTLPTGADHDFLLAQKLSGFTHKNITFDPATGRLAGQLRSDPASEDRLRGLFADFSRNVVDWLRTLLPGYAAHLTPDRATFRSEEEATRRLRMNARDDLLHIDNFPNRPTHGRRILRVYANVNPSEPRIWAISEPFAELLARFRSQLPRPGVPQHGWFDEVSSGLLRVFQPGRPRGSTYDSTMMRLHDLLKRSEEFQEKARKKLCSFPPGSVWLAMTDACSYAVLRGRFALEHSFFVGTEGLALPDEAPIALLAAAGRSDRSAAA